MAAYAMILLGRSSKEAEPLQVSMDNVARKALVPLEK
jgi:hypothetical protein